LRMGKKNRGRGGGRGGDHGEAKTMELTNEELMKTVPIVVGEMVGDVQVGIEAEMTEDGLRAVYQAGLTQFNHTKEMNLHLNDFKLRPDPAEVAKHPSNWSEIGFVSMILNDEPMILSQKTLRAIDDQRLAIGTSLHEQEVIPKKVKGKGKGSAKKTKGGGDNGDIRALMEQMNQKFDSKIEGLILENQQQKIQMKQQIEGLILENEQQNSQIENLMKTSAAHDHILRRKLIFEARKKVDSGSTLSPQAIALLSSGAQQGNHVAHDMRDDEISTIAWAVSAAQENREAWEELFFFQFLQPLSSYLELSV
jgi:hypothetical protein